MIGVRRGYAVLMIGLSVVALVVVMLGNAMYTRHVADRADRRQAELRAESERKQAELLAQMGGQFCEVLEAFTSDLPTTTPRSQDVAGKVLRLQRNLGCEGG